MDIEELGEKLGFDKHEKELVKQQMERATLLEKKYIKDPKSLSSEEFLELIYCLNALQIIKLGVLEKGMTTIVEGFRE